MIEAYAPKFLIPKRPIRECCSKSKATRSKKLPRRNIVLKHICIELTKIKHTLGIVTQEHQRLTPIPFTPTFTINYDPHLSTSIGRTEIKQINDTHHLIVVHTLYHQSKLLIHIEVVRIGLYVLL